MLIRIRKYLNIVNNENMNQLLKNFKDILMYINELKFMKFKC